MIHSSYQIKLSFNYSNSESVEVERVHISNFHTGKVDSKIGLLFQQEVQHVEDVD